MKVFHELAFEGYVLADAAGIPVYSDPRLMELLGAVDTVHVSGYSAQVSGTSPQLTISLEHSNDRSYWWPLNFFFPIINGLTLSTSNETLFQGVNPDATLARLAYGKLTIRLAGTNARAFLRVWVTGRDLSRRSAGNGKAQGDLAAARKQMMQMSNGTYRPKV